MLAMSGSPHQRLHSQPAQHYRNSSSPNSSCSDEDSDHSQPNDLTTSSRKHGNSHATFPSYPPFYSPPHPGSHLGGHHGGGGSQQASPYIATNECRIIEYRGARIAAFLSAKAPCEYLLCLPQAFELFLKHLVGGLHTVYTKLKRLDIVPIVCNVEQVRILRGLGAIQPGVNRCKLLSTKDFDVLFKDCTTARPGRPPKRSPIAGMVSPVPTSLAATAPQQQPNAVPYLGFPPAAKKPRYADDADFGNESIDVKHQGNSVTGGRDNAATAAAMLAANGYSAAFPFLQHFGGSTPSQQQQQLVAAAAALGLPGLPPNRFPNASPPPGLPPLNSHQGNATNAANQNSSANNHSGSGEQAGDFNPTAAYLWLLSQQQQHQSAAASALNLSARNAANAGANGASNGNGPLGVSGKHGLHGNSGHNNAGHDETTDDEDDDDVDSRHSSSPSENPVSSTGFNGQPLGSSGRSASERGIADHVNGQPPSGSPSPAQSAVQQLQQTGTGGGGMGPASQQQSGPEQHCLETLLRNIEGLLAIAAHNARQQQSQLHLQKAELRAELAAQIERERELREHIEKQLNEEQKIRMLYQKRFKKERRFRRKLEQELHLSQPASKTSVVSAQQPPGQQQSQQQPQHGQAPQSESQQQQQSSKVSPVCSPTGNFARDDLAENSLDTAGD